MAFLSVSCCLNYYADIACILDWNSGCCHVWHLVLKRLWGFGFGYTLQVELWIPSLGSVLKWLWLWSSLTFGSCPGLQLRLWSCLVFDSQTSVKLWLWLHFTNRASAPIIKISAQALVTLGLRLPYLRL